MLNIGVIGIGKIAQKAYLPVYTQLQDRARWYLMSRDLNKLTAASNRFGLAAAGTDLANMDRLELDAVMIHAATPAHYELVKHFLTHGLHVFVDKPLATDMAKVTELYMLAAQYKVMLTVGFNRRFVPAYQPLLALPEKQMISVMKTRVNKPLPAKQAIFDELIHPLDTALALAGFPESPNARFAVHTNDQHDVEQASVEFTAPGIRASASLNLVAGANFEETTIATPSGLYRVQNLSQATTYQDTGATQSTPPDWAQMLTTRGFKPMVSAFLDAVETGSANPVAPDTSRLTHQLLAEMASQF